MSLVTKRQYTTSNLDGNNYKMTTFIFYLTEAINSYFVILISSIM